jgi:tRNA (cytosine38-C5)-methyltransferase
MLPNKTYRVLEFFSGMGGMHAALRAADIPAVVVAAFDINEHANAVYEKNYQIPVKQVSLEKITAKELDKYDADIWLMSPPCQPYTRQGTLSPDAGPWQ